MNQAQRRDLEKPLDIAIALGCALVVFEACALARMIWASLAFANIELPAYTRWCLAVADRSLWAACLTYAGVWGSLWLVAHGSESGRGLSWMRLGVGAITLILAQALVEGVAMPRRRLNSCLCNNGGFLEFVLGRENRH